MLSVFDRLCPAVKKKFSLWYTLIELTITIKCSIKRVLCVNLICKLITWTILQMKDKSGHISYKQCSSLFHQRCFIEVYFPSERKQTIDTFALKDYGYTYKCLAQEVKARQHTFCWYEAVEWITVQWGLFIGKVLHTQVWVHIISKKAVIELCHWDHYNSGQIPWKSWNLKWCSTLNRTAGGSSGVHCDSLQENLHCKMNIWHLYKKT